MHVLACVPGHLYNCLLLISALKHITTHPPHTLCVRYEGECTTAYVSGSSSVLGTSISTSMKNMFSVYLYVYMYLHVCKGVYVGLF